MRPSTVVFVLLLLLPRITCYAQLLSSRCDSSQVTIEDCVFTVRTELAKEAALPGIATSPSKFFDLIPRASSEPTVRSLGDANPVTRASMISQPTLPQEQHFHWGRALFESFTFFSIEQAYVVHDDWAWVGGKYSENGVPFNHYWRDYKQSLSSWIHSGWNDGDPNMYGYVGHPIQGLATSYIYLQNDPKSENLEFSKTKAYWRSRLMATLWNAAYSAQWNIGPLSEPTIEKYGTAHRAPWNADGSFPCNTKHCYTGVGQIDLVMTPLGGAGWLVGEDFLDKDVTGRVEAATRNRFLIDFVRCSINPVMVGTNLLHGKRPWYRARDNRDVTAALLQESNSMAGRKGSARQGR